MTAKLLASGMAAAAIGAAAAGMTPAALAMASTGPARIPFITLRPDAPTLDGDSDTDAKSRLTAHSSDPDPNSLDYDNVAQISDVEAPSGDLWEPNSQPGELADRSADGTTDSDYEDLDLSESGRSESDRSGSAGSGSAGSGKSLDFEAPEDPPNNQPVGLFDWDNIAPDDEVYDVGSKPPGLDDAARQRVSDWLVGAAGAVPPPRDVDSLPPGLESTLATGAADAGGDSAADGNSSTGE